MSLVENLTIDEHFWPSIELVGRHQSFLNQKVHLKLVKLWHFLDLNPPTMLYPRQEVQSHSSREGGVEERQGGTTCQVGGLAARWRTLGSDNGGD